MQEGAGIRQHPHIDGRHPELLEIQTEGKEVIRGAEGMELTEGLKKLVAEARAERLTGKCSCGMQLDFDEVAFEDGLCFECYLTKFRGMSQSVSNRDKGA